MHKIKLFRNKRADAHTELDKIDVGDSVRETLSKVEEGKKIFNENGRAPRGARQIAVGAADYVEI